MSKKIKVLDSEEGYNLAAAQYDKKEKYLNSFEKGKLIPLLGDVNGKKILDVGAGTGRVSIALAQAGAQVTALDISGEMLQLLSRKNKKITTVMGDGENLPFEDDSFDIVVAAFFIVHLRDPKRFFDEVYRVLKPEGLFVVTNINQKEPPEVETNKGTVVIESFYHRPEKIREELEELAFGVEQEVFVKEGEVWVSQLVACRK